MANTALYINRMCVDKGVQLQHFEMQELSWIRDRDCQIADYRINVLSPNVGVPLGLFVHSEQEALQCGDDEERIKRNQRHSPIISPSYNQPILVPTYFLDDENILVIRPEVKKYSLTIHDVEWGRYKSREVVEEGNISNCKIKQSVLIRFFSRHNCITLSSDAFS
jgi:hypothetical protein